MRGLWAERANPVGATGITDLPMATGFLYLVAIIAWATRRVLAWPKPLGSRVASVSGVAVGY